jgi:hypothetical protein
VRLSVVVTIVEGTRGLERCLAALSRQTDAPDLEILVPADDTVPDLDMLRSAFPRAQFLPLGRLATTRPIDTHAGQHELFDRRRAAGLRAATGELVAILEDRSVPRPDWASAFVRAHAALSGAVIGGAIENGRDALLNWAVYFSDFGRYHLPFSAGPRRWVSDVNVAYKRRALDSTSELWRERYHETTVHWALQRAGETLYLDDRPIVDQMRDDLTIGRLMRERAAWGRLFAYTRARELSGIQRAGWAAVTPALPLLLFLRHARDQWARRQTFGRFLLASPLIFVLLVAWSAGEAAGYLSAEP